MATIKSAIKHARQSERRRQRNRAVRSIVRSSTKLARTALGDKAATAREAVRAAIRELDKAVTRGVIHRNTAARKKSALARRLAALG